MKGEVKMEELDREAGVDEDTEEWVDKDGKAAEEREPLSRIVLTLPVCLHGCSLSSLPPKRPLPRRVGLAVMIMG